MKSIANLIGEIENGQFEEDLNHKLNKMVAAVMELGLAGSLKIALTITPTGRSSVKVGAAFAVKEPEPPRETTTFFVGEGNTLQRNDPAQHQLPLKVVRMPDSGELRKVDAAE